MPRFEGPYLMYVILNQIGILKTMSMTVWHSFQLRKNKNLKTSNV